MSSISLAFFLIRFQISIVNMTEHELNTEVSEDIRAAIMTATINPLKPLGITSIINLGYAIFEQPFSLPHIVLHFSGSLHAISSVKLEKSFLIEEFFYYLKKFF